MMDSLPGIHIVTTVKVETRRLSVYSPYYYRGSGYNYVCLQRKPTFGYEQSDYSQSAGELYGVQYATGSGNIPELRNVNGATVPCAACEAPRSGVFMYPGKSKLYSVCVNINVHMWLWMR